MVLQAEENALITSVGVGTAVGNLMREYWIPAMLSSELPRPDGDPVRVLLLGERLVAFRDSHGNVGLLQHLCPHRQASLFYGRNENGCLTCIYHGWKFDFQGNCKDIPNAHVGEPFKRSVKATSYPCVERGGVVFAYMGPRSVPPPLPDLEGNQLPEGEYKVTAYMRDCNWLQGLEGDADTSHQGFLHHGMMRPEDQTPGTFRYYIAKDRAPRYVVEDTDYGIIYGAYRPAAHGQLYWRIAQYLFPFWVQTPQGVLGDYIIHRAWVPLDDTHTMVYTITGIGRENRAHRASSGRTGMELKPNNSDWLGRFRLVAEAENDYLIDRQAQRESTFSGIRGIFTQDQAVTESMGEILDRSAEHLCASDVMVVRVRRRIMEATARLVETNLCPPGVDNPKAYRVRAGGVFLPEGAPWLAATEHLREAYSQHENIDRSLVGEDIG